MSTSVAVEFETPLHGFEEFVFALTCTTECIFLPLMVYLTLYRSENMKSYRYYILNNVVWCFLFDFAPLIIRPVFMFPQTCIIFNPIVDMSANTCRFFFLWYVVCIVNVALGAGWSLLYRYAQAFQNWMTFAFEHDMLIAFAHLWLNIGLVLVYLTQLIGATVGGEPVFKQRFHDYLPQLAGLEDRLPIICFPYKMKTVYFIISIMVILVGIFVLGVVLMTILWSRILASRGRQGERGFQAFRLQTMLFKALFAQITVTGCCVAFPGFVMSFIFVFRTPAGPEISSLCTVLFALHGCFDYLTMVILIAPYRKTVFKWLGLARKKTCIVEPTVSMCPKCMTVVCGRNEMCACVYRIGCHDNICAH